MQGPDPRPRLGNLLPELPDIRARRNKTSRVQHRKSRLYCPSSLVHPCDTALTRNYNAYLQGIKIHGPIESHPLSQASVQSAGSGGVSVPLVHEIVARLLLVSLELLAEAVQRCDQPLLVQNALSQFPRVPQLLLTLPDSAVQQLSLPDVRELFALVQVLHRLGPQVELYGLGRLSAQVLYLAGDGARLRQLLHLSEALEIDGGQLALEVPHLAPDARALQKQQRRRRSDRL